MLGLLVLLTLPAPALQAASSQQFEERIRPLLRQHCFACHGDAVAKSDLNLETLADERAYQSRPRPAGCLGVVGGRAGDAAEGRRAAPERGGPRAPGGVAARQPGGNASPNWIR